MKNASLKQYFPLIPTRQDLLEEIQANQKQNTIFQGWAPEAQEEFLDFCTGVRGVKILYDGIFKEIMNPETAPEYLNELLSLLLGKKVEIIRSSKSFPMTTAALAASPPSLSWIL